MARSPRVSDETIFERLSSAVDGLTAAELGVTTARLKALEGVKVVGALKTGRSGRPRLLFGLA